MPDLFPLSQKLEQLPIADADISYSPKIDFGTPERDILASLINSTEWRQEDVTLWGKKYKQPRLIAWHGDTGNSYSYSGIHLAPQQWTPLLLNIKSKVEFLCSYKFNSVLLNYYRDNNDSMGFHSDDEPELGKRPIIASVSVGEERTLVFKHKHQTEKPHRFRLASGSLLVMKGETQTFWKHGIEKERKPSGPRVNLTFRQIFQIS